MGYIPLQKGIVYGPIKSKRLGRSLGINLSPAGQKVCTFNCVYCFYGPTTATEGDFVDVDDVGRALTNALKRVGDVDYITFAGNGEPTLHPEFDAVVAAVRRIRDRYATGTPVALLSNSSLLSRDTVAATLPFIDLAMLKLDCADQTTFLRVNRPMIKVDIDEIVDALAALKERPVIQSVVVRGKVESHKGEALEAWLAALQRIKPKYVQVYTLDEELETVGIRPATRDEMSRIEEALKRRGIDVALYR